MQTRFAVVILLLAAAYLAPGVVEIARDPTLYVYAPLLAPVTLVTAPLRLIGIEV